MKTLRFDIRDEVLAEYVSEPVNGETLWRFAAHIPGWGYVEGTAFSREDAIVRLRAKIGEV